MIDDAHQRHRADRRRARRRCLRQAARVSHRSILSTTMKKHHAHQDHEADRGIGAGEVVALGEIVDELAEPAEIDQEFDADDVDQREDQPELEADEDRRQRRGEQDFPEHLPRRELEAAADIDQHAAGARQALDGLQDHRPAGRRRSPS